MSNIIILSLLGVGLITSLSFLYSVKGEITTKEKVYVKGNHNQAIKQVEIKDFANIRAFDQIELVLRQGPQKIEIKAEENLIDYVIVVEKDGYLEAYIDTKGDNVDWNTPLTVEVTNPIFLNIEGNQQSMIKVLGQLNQDMLNIDLRDQSNFNGRIEVEKITIRLRQQSNAHLIGNGLELDADLRDQSGFKASNMECKVASISMSQQSDASIFATDAVTGIIEDRSELSVKGEPVKITVKKSDHAEILTIGN